MLLFGKPMSCYEYFNKKLTNNCLLRGKRIRRLCKEHRLYGEMLRTKAAQN